MDIDRRNQVLNILSRSPSPSVNTYILLSFIAACFYTFDAYRTLTTQPEIHSLLQEEMRNSTFMERFDDKTVDAVTSNGFVQSAYFVLNNQPYVWIAINSYFAWLALTAKIMIKVFCRELSRQEEAVVRHRFFSFILFSIVFLSVVAGVNQSLRVLPWLVWFGFTGFMTILHEVAQQRFKFVAPSSGVTGGRLSWFCFCMFVMSYSTFHALLKYNRVFTLSHFFFLMVDSVLSLARSIHGLLRCLSASDRFSSSPDTVRHFNYWLDLTVSVLVEIIQLLNYVHLMFYSPIGFNLTCLFFFYHIKQSYHSIMMTLSRHRKHNLIFQHILSTYPVEKADDGDLCIVCWESLGDSRRLPCRHQFHDWCLMWWLAQDTSCPTCRCAVPAPQPPVSPASNTTTVRFGGGVGFLRLPSFAIEFSTSAFGFGPFLRRQVAPHDDSQLMGMAQQVHEMFPQLPIDAIVDDIRISGSTQGTIENILEGRVGFVGGLPGDESENDSWHGDDDTIGLVDDDASTSEDEPMIRADIEEYSRSRTTTESSEFGQRKKDMVAMYRRRYLASEKGKSLRDRGITC